MIDLVTSLLKRSIAKYLKNLIILGLQFGCSWYVADTMKCKIDYLLDDSKVVFADFFFFLICAYRLPSSGPGERGISAVSI